MTVLLNVVALIGLIAGIWFIYDLRRIRISLWLQQTLGWKIATFITTIVVFLIGMFLILIGYVILFGVPE